ncbi:hypothetical protein RCS94_09040 [Orbaceae bacterium ac157xtp]
MKNHLIYIGITLALVGCSSNSQKSLNENYSRAYNLYHAGGLNGLNDSKVPTEQYKTLTQGATYASAYSVVGYHSASMLGMNPLSAAGLNFLSILTSASGDPSRSHIFAWLPANTVNNKEDAKTKFKNEVVKALKKTTKQFGGSIEYAQTFWGSDIYLIYNEKWNCNKNNECGITIKITDPILEKTPTFINNNSSESFFFTGKNSAIMMTNNHSNVPQFEFLQKLSSNLPNWSILYLSNKEVKEENSVKIKIPVILEHGKIELFVMPK